MYDEILYERKIMKSFDTFEQVEGMGACMKRYCGTCQKN